MKLTFHKSIAGRRGAGRRAFSLIEIMVSVSLLSVIIVGLLLMFYQVQRAFRAGTTQVDILEGGRATMNILVRDLQEMTACRLTNSPNIVNCLIRPSTLPDGSPIAATATPTHQDLPSGSRRTNWLQDITFLSRQNDEWRAISYRVVFATNGVGTLYRLLETTNRMTLADANSNALRNISLVSQTEFSAVSTNYHRVVDGVVSFDVRALDTNGFPFPNIDPTSPPANPNDRWSPNIFVDVAGARYEFFGDEVPAYVDVELAILEPTALAKFRAREEVSQTQALEYLGRQVGKTHVFRQRVAIRPATAQLRSLTFN